jgi:metal-sulfur cluster biosynthetic enzyme
MAVVSEGGLAEAALAALEGVRDPELDESLPALGFVAGVLVGDDGVAQVRLRLPTYWCAPNFAYLMAADAQAAVRAVPGVRGVRVLLEDHYASEEINGGLAGEQGFDEVFAGDASGEGLEELRLLFRRKGFVARQQRLCEALLAEGVPERSLAELTLADLPAGEATDIYLHRRAELGLDCSPGAPFVVSAAGEPVGAARMGTQLRMGRTVKVSIEGNAGLCRGLLATRYGEEER